MKTGPIILVLAGIALLAFLNFAPVTPPQENEDTEAPVSEATADELNEADRRVEAALRKLESGEAPPMEAILEIRNVAEEYPDNIRANFTLGILSMRSAQYAKAVERFEKILSLDASDGHTWRMLAEAQMMTGDTATARQSLQEALERVDDKTGQVFKKELPHLSIN